MSPDDYEERIGKLEAALAAADDLATVCEAGPDHWPEMDEALAMYQKRRELVDEDDE